LKVDPVTSFAERWPRRQSGIYDVGGRLVRRLGRGERAAGTQRVAWDGLDDSGRHLGAGIYVARVRTETTTLTAKVLRVE